MAQVKHLVLSSPHWKDGLGITLRAAPQRRMDRSDALAPMPGENDQSGEFSDEDETT
jgi:hypothetical protein